MMGEICRAIHQEAYTQSSCIVGICPECLNSWQETTWEAQIR